MTSPISRLLTICGAAFALSLATTFVTRAVARRAGFVAQPRAERWHTRPTALAGGVGIFSAFIVPAVFVGGPLKLPLLLGSGAMFLLGFVDDVVHLKPYTKLIAQIVVATAATAWGPQLPWTPYPLLNQSLTVFWIIGITNAINLLDNMDGLAGGIACIAVIFQSAFFVLQNQYTEAALCAALAGAIGGFLVYNVKPASIFMGDCGSLFLGYTLAEAALYQNYGRSRGLVAVIAIPILVLLIPIFDTTFVTMTRIVRGRPVSQGGRDHTSHRLVTLGLSEGRSVMVLWGAGALAGLIALFARRGMNGALFVGVPLLLLSLAIIGVHLARTDRPDKPDDRRSFLLSLHAFGYKRRVFEILMDIVLAMTSIAGAFLLRFDGDIPDAVLHDLMRVFPLLVSCKIVALFATGAYDGIWQYAGMRDMIRLGRGAAAGSVLAILLVAMWLRFGTLSRGALVVDGLLYALLLVSARLSFRVLRTFLSGRGEREGTRVLLWGAGDVGEAVVRNLLDRSGPDVVPVGFVDDDPLKTGRTIHGLRVLGTSKRIADLIQAGTADAVLLTSERIAEEQLSNVILAIGHERVQRLRFLVESVAPQAA